MPSRVAYKDRGTLTPSAKFPRIPHLPFSPGASPDDLRLKNAKSLLGLPVVLTEKMDGANVALTREHVYARSHSSPARGPVFDELKAYHATVRHLIPAGLTVFAEWCLAVHSIEYEGDRFPRLFVLAVRDDEKHEWFDWEYTFLWAGRLGASPVPKMRLDVFAESDALRRAVEQAAKGPSAWRGGPPEGVVVRPVSGLLGDFLFGRHVAKYVRADFRPGEALGGHGFRRQPGAVPGLSEVP